MKIKIIFVTVVSMISWVSTSEALVIGYCVETPPQEQGAGTQRAVMVKLVAGEQKVSSVITSNKHEGKENGVKRGSVILRNGQWFGENRLKDSATLEISPLYAHPAVPRGPGLIAGQKRGDSTTIEVQAEDTILLKEECTSVKLGTQESGDTCRIVAYRLPGVTKFTAQDICQQHLPKDAVVLTSLEHQAQ